MDHLKLKLGIISGSGKLPYEVIEYCIDHNITPFIVSFNFKMHAYCRFHNIKHITGKLGKIGKIVEFFSQNNVTNIIMAGPISRYDVSLLNPDDESKKLLKVVSEMKYRGDNSVLLKIIEFFEQIHKFKVLPVQQFLPEISFDNQNIEVSDYELEQINMGIEYLNITSEFDIGQAVIIRDGRIIAVEGEEGTENMMKRIKKDKNGILVKIPKIGQTMVADVPAIGPSTIKLAAKQGIAIIAINLSGSIIIEKDKTIDLARRYGINIVCVK